MAEPHPKFIAAAVQASPVFMDLDATVSKTVDLIAEAAAAGARLIAFPECWIPGYPLWAWLDSPAWAMQFVQRYSDNALVVDSDQMRRIQSAAKQHDIVVALGFAEHAHGTLYIAQALIGGDGRHRFVRRKLKPTHIERAIFGEGDGSDLHVVDTDLGRIGGLCCWEHLQPLTKYAYYAMHEQIHVASWPAFGLYKDIAYSLGHEINLRASQIYALEGQCFVIASTALVDAATVELLVDAPAKSALLETGGGYSKIFAPDGRQISEDLPQDQEGLVLAEIDLGMIALAKAVADPAGHYARADVTRLLVNRQKRVPVTAVDEDPAAGDTARAGWTDAGAAADGGTHKHNNNGTNTGGQGQC